MSPPPELPANNEPEAPANLEFKALLLLLFMLALVVGSAIYVLYSRGAFESTQKLILVAEDSEGVVVGMDMTFAGFPIGRVRRIELAADGKARIVLDVPSKDANWLRTSSVFTLVRGLVGNVNIRAYSGVLTDPPLPDGAERAVLVGDTNAEIPKVVASAKELLENLNALTASGSALAATLNNAKQATAKLNGPRGALGLLTGNDADAQKIITTLERTNALLARLDGLALRADGLVAKADVQVFGASGLLPTSQAAIQSSAQNVNKLLEDARASMKRLDAVLVEAQAATANVREGTADLGPLRAQTEANLRKLEGLINDINRLYPFAKPTEIKLP
jgi:phospholipid/cholesterol/gamma-HCH transport system substrate-binding protein